MGRAPRRRGRQAREQSTRQSTLGKGGESEQRVRVGNHLDCGGEEGQRSGGTKGRSTGRGSISVVKVESSALVIAACSSEVIAVQLDCSCEARGCSEHDMLFVS